MDSGKQAERERVLAEMGEGTVDKPRITVLDEHVVTSWVEFRDGHEVHVTQARKESLMERLTRRRKEKAAA